jgi:hypothetical protein
VLWSPFRFASEVTGVLDVIVVDEVISAAVVVAVVVCFNMQAAPLAHSISRFDDPNVKEPLLRPDLVVGDQLGSLSCVVVARLYELGVRLGGGLKTGQPVF